MGDLTWASFLPNRRTHTRMSATQLKLARLFDHPFSKKKVIHILWNVCRGKNIEYGRLISDANIDNVQSHSTYSQTRPRQSWRFSFGNPLVALQWFDCDGLLAVVWWSTCWRYSAAILLKRSIFIDCCCKINQRFKLRKNYNFKFIQNPKPKNSKYSLVFLSSLS